MIVSHKTQFLQVISNYICLARHKSVCLSYCPAMYSAQKEHSGEVSYSSIRSLKQEGEIVIVTKSKLIRYVLIE